ncbi:MAG: RNA-binding transcriptional accessory protein [Bacteroidales bacterium]|nr:RNA-binding transcriptional accessory protein [Bacteroidales bacterium]
MEEKYIKLIANELGVRDFQVINTINLLKEGATVPFIARYRKEMTGSLDEVQISAVRDRYERIIELEKRREAIINSVTEQGFMTPEIQKQLEEAATLSELEDIYLPYKPKRRTRATIAREKGLEPLAKIVMSQQMLDPFEKAKSFIDPSKDVSTVDEALAGARDIIAEWVNENKHGRERIRNLFNRDSKIQSRPVKGKELEGIKYEAYFDWEESLMKAPSHRLLAMLRGENEGFLKVGIEPSQDDALEILNRIFVKSHNSCSDQVEIAVKDSYKRLLQPSMETEYRQIAKERADLEAIRVFAENLRQLLLAPPLGQKNVLALDPGFRTGCKIAILDRQGKLIHNETIYPHPPQNEVKQASAKIQTLVKAYKIEAIAIGNGTAGRETENFVKRIPFESNILALMVNESGASVYSASDVARQEFPDYDVTVRGAVSIGRRLMDPLSELVKIDPKSIGVGQYQHDVNQQQLQKGLEDVVVSCVNKVGVELNTASKQLLTHVSGVGPVLAAKIVEYREKNGNFESRDELKKVPRLGDKAFEQAAGFLRIRESQNPLDRSAVHPESYTVVKRMADKAGCSVSDLMQNGEIRKQLKLEEFVTSSVGMPTLTDIMQELDKPGRDPREKYEFFEFDKNVNSIADVIPGMILPGIITNITNFGAFVDIGVHQDGLVHVSQLADRFIKDPNQVVKLNQKVMVKILEVDKERKRIQLTMKGIQ